MPRQDRNEGRNICTKSAGRAIEMLRLKTIDLNLYGSRLTGARCIRYGEKNFAVRPVRGEFGAEQRDVLACSTDHYRPGHLVRLDWNDEMRGDPAPVWLLGDGGLHEHHRLPSDIDDRSFKPRTGEIRHTDRVFTRVRQLDRHSFYDAVPRRRICVGIEPRLRASHEQASTDINRTPDQERNHPPILPVSSHNSHIISASD